MKRYLLFMFDNFYPLGGMNDLVGSYDLLEEAIPVRIKDTKSFYYGARTNFTHPDSKNSYNYYHVYDLEKDIKIRRGNPRKEISDYD